MDDDMTVAQCRAQRIPQLPVTVAVPPVSANPKILQLMELCESDG
jgi:hypothetical protein